MKLKINFKKIMAAFILIMIVGSAFIGNINTVYGKINSVYEASGEVGTIDVEDAESNTTVLDAVGYFVYAIATFIEKIGGKIIASFTGSEMFPWADRVIFNTIPFLDVNFLSPSNGSMFRDTSGKNTIFGDIIANIYYTLFVISIAFFGVVVGIMALRLAISSIASEKAKYKQAITNWLLALILIFTVHYLISFVFFVNEKMVEVASSIFKAQIEANQDKIEIDMNVSNDPELLEQIFNKLFNAYYKYWGEDEDVYCATTLGQGSNYIKLVTVYDGNFHYKFYNKLTKDYSYQRGTVINYLIHDSEDVALQWQFNGTGEAEWGNVNGITKDLSADSNAIVEERFRYYLGKLLSNSTYIEEHRTGIANMISSNTGWFHEIDWNDNEGAAYRDFRRIINDALWLTNNDNLVRQTLRDNGDFSESEYFNTSPSSGALAAQMNVEWMTNTEVNYGSEVRSILENTTFNSNDSKENVYEMIYNLADYFKNAVYISNIDTEANYDEGEELVNIEFQPIVAILYSIFVIQSIMYFIAYMKRFFYIIVLALFAPLIIIYDFLMKSAM